MAQEKEELHMEKRVFATDNRDLGWTQERQVPGVGERPAGQKSRRSCKREKNARPAVAPRGSEEPREACQHGREQQAGGPDKSGSQALGNQLQACVLHVESHCVIWLHSLLL